LRLRRRLLLLLPPLLLLLLLHRLHSLGSLLYPLAPAVTS
jgi:hypothetical protein